MRSEACASSARGEDELHAILTTSTFYGNAQIDADRLIGAKAMGIQIAFNAVDSDSASAAALK